jgi:hypothetical protein
MGKMQLQTCICNTIALDSSSSLPMRGIEYSSQDISSQCLGKKHNSTDIMSITSLLSINSRGTVDPKCVNCHCLRPFTISPCNASEKGQKRTCITEPKFSIQLHICYPAPNTSLMNVSNATIHYLPHNYYWWK